MDRLEISLLGSFQVTWNQESSIRFRTDKQRALLAYLVLHARAPQRREMLAGLLWPDQPDATALRYLRIALNRLRAAIGDREAVPPFLAITHKSIQFNLQSDHWLDVEAFAGLLEACEQHVHRRVEVCRSCRQRMQEAADLYRGDLLPGFSLPSTPFEAWLVVQREQLNREALETFRCLATCFESSHEYGQAERFARRQLELEPWREEAHRQCMRVLALDGRRNAALAQYETCRRVLAEELDVEPTEETTALYDRIRDGIDVGSLAQASPSSLPIPLAPLIGREAELAEIDDRLQDPACRLLTLVGPGGIGKTRLALEAAAEQVYGFEHGVFYVSLAPLQSAEGLVPAIAQELGFVFSGRDAPRQQLLRYLRRKEMLLLLDNYEHLLSAPEFAFPEVDPGERSDTVGLVVDILRAAPDVRILITSRARLNVPEEQLLHVGGMDYPPPAPESAAASGEREAQSDRMKDIRAQDVARYSAVQLFVRCARRVREGYEPVEEVLAHVARICQMVQGMPLAILLAAAWMEVLSPAEISDKVGRGLAFLDVDWRGVAERHRSLIAVFDASWRMLSATERAAFARMSVFRGGCTAEAAAAVAGASLHTLRGLAHKSFLNRGKAERYEVHELLRQYAECKLDETPGERQRTFDLYCAYYAQFLAQRQDEFRKRGARHALAERANIHAAWTWALQHDRVPEIRRCLEGFFWFGESTVSWYREKGAGLAPAVDLLRRADPTQENQLALGLALCYQACALGITGLREAATPLAQEGLSLLCRLGTGRVLALGHILAALGGVTKNETQRKQLLEQALAIAQEADGLLEACWAHNLLAFVALRQTQYDQAERHWLTFLSIAKEIDHPRGEAISLRGLAKVAYLRGQYARARIFQEQSLTIFRELGEQWWIAGLLDALGKVALASGDLEQARAHYREALSLAEEMAALINIAGALCGLGDVALATGDVLSARQHYRRALQVALEDPRVDAGRQALISLAKLYAHKGKRELAVELIALALNVRPDLWYETEALQAELRSGLSLDVYVAAQARGRARDLEATVEELLDDLTQ